MNLLLAALLVLLPQADKVNYYTVEGRTAAEVRTAMNRVRPTGSGGMRFDARTTWDVKWRYRYNTAPAGGVGTSLDVTATTEMALPQWTTESRAPQGLQNKWNA